MAQAAKACHGVHRAGGPVGDVRGTNIRLINQLIHPEVSFDHALALIESMPLSRAHGSTVFSNVRHEALIPIIERLTRKGIAITSAFKDATELAALRPRTFKIPLAIVVLAETLAHHDRFEAQGYRRLKLGYLVSRVLRTELATLPEDSPPGLADVLRDLIKSVARSHNVSEE
jgi:hypothetical protein